VCRFIDEVDEKLSVLVDERQVVSGVCEWPEAKTDMIREFKALTVTIDKLNKQGQAYIQRFQNPQKCKKLDFIRDATSVIDKIQPKYEELLRYSSCGCRAWGPFVNNPCRGVQGQRRLCAQFRPVQSTI